MWAPLFIIPVLLKDTQFSIPLLLIFVGLFAAFGSIITPAWWSLIGDLVPEGVRGRYFGLRNKVSGIFGIIAVLVAGYLLDVFSKTNVITGFAILFGTALIARLISCSFLKQMQDVEYDIKDGEKFTFAAFLKKLRYTNFGKFTIFFTLMSFAVNFAGPFFTVYMLKELKFSYSLFTAMVMAQSIIYYLTMPYWGRNSDRYGNKHIMTVCGLLIPLVPLLWMLSTNIYYLFAVQLFAGFVWAGFDLTGANFIFDSVSPQKRARVVGYYNVLLGLSIFLGATAGGLAATYLRPIALFGSIKTIFLISGVLRLLVAVAMLPGVEEARAKVNLPEKKLFLKLIFINPFKSIVHETTHDVGWALDHVKMLEGKAGKLFRR